MMEVNSENEVRRPIYATVGRCRSFCNRSKIRQSVLKHWEAFLPSETIVLPEFILQVGMKT